MLNAYSLKPVNGSREWMVLTCDLQIKYNEATTCPRNKYNFYQQTKTGTLIAQNILSGRVNNEKILLVLLVPWAL